MHSPTVNSFIFVLTKRYKVLKPTGITKYYCENYLPVLPLVFTILYILPGWPKPDAGSDFGENGTQISVLVASCRLFIWGPGPIITV